MSSGAPPVDSPADPAAVPAEARPHGGDRATRPDFSLIVPCYNEEDVVGYTIRRLVKAFDAAEIDLEIVACDNGSSDGTGELLRRFEADGFPVVSHRVEVNEGYGKGVLESLAHCRADWIGIIPADGQVDAEDVVRLFESVCRTDGRVLGKVHRRFRLDGPVRAAVSFVYNLFINTLFPGIGSSDVNGSPKILHRDAFRAMELESKDWLLDAEMMIKARVLGLGVLEMNVFSRMREQGVSHVRATTCSEFVRRLVGFRLGRGLRGWSARVRAGEIAFEPAPSDPRP